MVAGELLTAKPYLQVRHILVGRELASPTAMFPLFTHDKHCRGYPHSPKAFLGCNGLSHLSLRHALIGCIPEYRTNYHDQMGHVQPLHHTRPLRIGYQDSNLDLAPRTRGGDRTHDLEFKRLLLCQSELHGHVQQL